MILVVLVVFATRNDCTAFEIFLNTQLENLLIKSGHINLNLVINTPHFKMCAFIFNNVKQKQPGLTARSILGHLAKSMYTP